MTPRERVLRCFNHEKADRVPLSGSFRSEVWEKLRRHFGTEDTKAITEELGFDFKSAGMGPDKNFVKRSISTNWGGRVIPHDDGTCETEWGCALPPGKTGVTCVISSARSLTNLTSIPISFLPSMRRAGGKALRNR